MNANELGLVRGTALDYVRDIAASARHPDFEGREVFRLEAPCEQRVPLVFNTPHSGRDYPVRFRRTSRLDAAQLRRSEDGYIDELFRSVVAMGAPLLAANFPRAWLDVNREPYEFDPRMFDGPLPHYANVRSVRVAGGLGTVPRLVAEGRDIYKRRLPVSEALSRVELVYKPYHEALRTLMASTHRTFGHAILVDCHSMPSVIRDGENGRPDIVVGDRFGTAAARALTELAVSLLRDRGYAVARNKPYAGGFITEHYGRPARNLHAIQIELNRGLYVNERTQQRTAGFSALLEDMAGFVTEFMARCEIAIGTPRPDLDLEAAE